MQAKSWFRIALTTTCFFASGAAFAQACTTVDPILTFGNFLGNSCGKNLGLSTICGGGDPTNGAGTALFTFNAGPAVQPLLFAVTSTTAGFNPELALIGAPCSSLSACSIDDTNNTQTVPASGFDAPNPAVVAGTYFVIVTDLNPETPGCGDFNLTVGGELPVHLQDFSVD